MKAGMAMLISNNTFQDRELTRDKKVNFIMIKGSLHQEDI